MKPISIDLNCDMGESYGRFKVGNDAAIFPFISSCNIACGFHGGDPLTIEHTLKIAVDYDVRIGAHPSFPDLSGFGRRNMDLSESELIALLKYQIAALKGMAESCGGKLSYVKPHGALYNKAAKDTTVSHCIIQAVQAIDPSLQLMGLAGSQTQIEAKKAGINFIAEAFADRRYDANGQLRSRRLKGSVLHNVQEVVDQVLSIIKYQRVQSFEGHAVPMQAQSICVHGDTPNALELLKALDQAFQAENIIRKAR